MGNVDYRRWGSFDGRSQTLSVRWNEKRMTYSRTEYRRHDVPDDYLEKWQKTIDVLARVLNVPAGLIMRVLPEEIEVLISSRTDDNPYDSGERADLGTGLYCETVMATKALLHVENALEDPEWRGNPDTKIDMNSYLGVPLIWPDGSVFGTVCVLDRSAVPAGEEYVQLLEQFKQMIERDFQLLDRNAELSEALEQLEIANGHLQKANRRMHRDLAAAREIQQALLPKQEPRTDRIRVDWAYHPCEELGGDMLNVFALGNDEIGLFVLDVTGHGVPAALLSFTASRELWPYAGHNVSISANESARFSGDLAKRVEAMNRAITMEATAGRFLTLFYGVLRLSSRRLRFISAGHPYPLLLRDGTVQELGIPGFPVGVLAEAEYKESSVTLQSEDRLYVYSDGLVEESSSSRGQFGVSGLKKALLETRDLPLNESVDTIIQKVHDWSGNDMLTDDASLIAVEVPDSS